MLLDTSFVTASSHPHENEAGVRQLGRGQEDLRAPTWHQDEVLWKTV